MYFNGKKIDPQDIWLERMIGLLRSYEKVNWLHNFFHKSLAAIQEKCSFLYFNIYLNRFGAALHWRRKI